MAFRVSLFLAQKVGVRLGGWTINWWNAATDQSAVVTRTRALALAIFNYTGVGVSVNGRKDSGPQCVPGRADGRVPRPG